MNEMLQKTAENQRNKFELLKSPIVAEFLGFKNEDSYIESDLESAILTHIRDFLMEMGKGFAFVARQQHIVTTIFHLRSVSGTYRSDLLHSFY